jgi:hypothetical protein
MSWLDHKQHTLDGQLGDQRVRVGLGDVTWQSCWGDAGCTAGVMMGALAALLAVEEGECEAAGSGLEPAPGAGSLPLWFNAFRQADAVRVMPQACSSGAPDGCHFHEQHAWRQCDAPTNPQLSSGTRRFQCGTESHH